jgi:glycine/D-amino acid oxidase-like deaminating enzyme
MDEVRRGSFSNLGLMNQKCDDVVVGAGILGLAHAYHLAKRGRRVVVVERSPKAMGASVRNFGML